MRKSVESGQQKLLEILYASSELRGNVIAQQLLTYIARWFARLDNKTPEKPCLVSQYIPFCAILAKTGKRIAEAGNEIRKTVSAFLRGAFSELVMLFQPNLLLYTHTVNHNAHTPLSLPAKQFGITNANKTNPLCAASSKSSPHTSSYTPKTRHPTPSPPPQPSTPSTWPPCPPPPP